MPLLKKFKNPIVAALLLLFGHATLAIPMCAFDRFNIAMNDVLNYHYAMQYFIVYSAPPDSPEPYELIAFDDDCNLLYKRNFFGKPIGIFDADYVTPAGNDVPMIFLTKSIGAHGYSVDVYLDMDADDNRKASVKPLILDLRSESMMPQFPPTNFPRPNILVCNNGKHDCDIYVYAPRKEKFIKQQSYHCDQPCSIAKIRAEMIQQPKSRIRTKSKP